MKSGERGEILEVLANLTLIGIFLRGEILDVIVGVGIGVETRWRGPAAEAVEEGARRVGSGFGIGVGVGVGDVKIGRKRWMDWGMGGRIVEA